MINDNNNNIVKNKKEKKNGNRKSRDLKKKKIKDPIKKYITCAYYYVFNYAEHWTREKRKKIESERRF